MMAILAWALVLPGIFLAIAVPSCAIALWEGAPWREVVNCFLPASLRL